MGLFNSINGTNSYGRPIMPDVSPGLPPLSFNIVPPPAPAPKAAAPGDKKSGMPDGMMNSIMKLFGRAAPDAAAAGAGGPLAQGGGGLMASGMDPMTIAMMFGA